MIATAGERAVRPCEVRGLVKRDGGLTVVDRVDLTVERGDVYPTRALAGVAGIIEEPRLYPCLSGRANPVRRRDVAT